MPLPRNQKEVILPLLKLINERKKLSMSDALEELSNQFKLTKEEREECYETSGSLIFKNVVAFASLNLRLMGFAELLKEKGHVGITKEGEDYSKNYKDNEKEISERLSALYKKMSEERKQKALANGALPTSNEIDIIVESKEQKIERIVNLFKELEEGLEEEILGELKNTLPQYFEKLVLKVLEAMGYGETEVTRYSNDGGIDGIVKRDKLGFDKIYMQAKRYTDITVATSKISEFIGNKPVESKGVFITTSTFPKGAKEKAEEKGVVLIDGEYLVKLMIKYRLGVIESKTKNNSQFPYTILEIDKNFFKDEELD